MIETLLQQTEYTETDIIANTKQELFSFKETIKQTTESKKEGFGSYLQDKGIDTQKFPRESGLGKFLRTFRYYKEIKNISTQKGIPTSYFFGLKMIEGEGDPTNINTRDGGTGISQIQPDTFKRFTKNKMGKNYKVFYDTPKYSAYNYDTLMKSSSMKSKYPKELDRRAAVNKIIADKLVEIRRECKYDMNKLMALDDRFNPQIALEFSAEYLLYCKKQVKTETLTDKSRDVYKNNKGFDFERMLAFNGYNKGPKRYGVDFAGNHLSNLKQRIEQYELYSYILDILIAQGYDNKDILDGLTTYAQTIDPTITRKRDRKPPEGVIYKGISNDKKYGVYEYTVKTKNIYSLINLIESFGEKGIIFTDEKGKKIDFAVTPLQSGMVIYIKQPL